ncbi:hypothetical protein [Aliamphritea spongicola]|nr:hypothetical protein [Aliamphritea spongicola]
MTGRTGHIEVLAEALIKEQHFAKLGFFGAVEIICRKRNIIGPLILSLKRVSRGICHGYLPRA